MQPAVQVCYNPDDIKAVAETVDYFLAPDGVVSITPSLIFVNGLPVQYLHRCRITTYPLQVGLIMNTCTKTTVDYEVP